MSTQQTGELSLLKSNGQSVILDYHYDYVMRSYIKDGCNGDKVYEDYSSVTLELCIDTPTPITINENLDPDTTGIYKDMDGTRFTIVLDENFKTDFSVPVGIYDFVMSQTDLSLIKKVLFTGKIEFIEVC